jgi:hypothetical protein
MGHSPMSSYRVVMALSQAQDLFFELLFGEGAIFGLVLLISIFLLLSVANRYIGACFIPVSLLLIIEYMAHGFYWGSIIMVFVTVILFINLGRGLKGG